MDGGHFAESRRKTQTINYVQREITQQLTRSIKLRGGVRTYCVGDEKPNGEIRGKNLLVLKGIGEERRNKFKVFGLLIRNCTYISG